MVNLSCAFFVPPLTTKTYPGVHTYTLPSSPCLDLLLSIWPSDFHQQARLLQAAHSIRVLSAVLFHLATAIAPNVSL